MMRLESPPSSPPASTTDPAPPLILSDAQAAMAPPLTPLALAGCDAPEDDAEEKLSLLSAASPQQTAWLARLELGVKEDAMTRDYHTTAASIAKEVGDASRVSDEWEVIAPLGATAAACCGGFRKPRVIEVVTLRHANFGLRWAGATAKRSHHQPHDQDDSTTAASPFCIVGPHWWLMAATFTVLLLAALMVTVLTVPHAGRGEAAMGVILSTACLTMYAKVACTNPGIVSHLAAPICDDYTYCDECESYRPPGALHCMDCRVCIDGYDHHCPWTGKCIGKGNVKYFYAWLVFLVLAFVYEMIEFTTYMLPPENQPHPSFLDEDDDDSFSLRTVSRTPLPSPLPSGEMETERPFSRTAPVFRRP